MSFPAPRLSFTLRAGDHQVRLGPRTVIVGILNCTPDSFSDGGHFFSPSAALARLERLVYEGADWIDVGGESTRPGAAPVPPDEEWRRIAPVFEEIKRSRFPLPVSVDTRKASVASRALDAGAAIVNDVSALRHDPEMARVAREARALVVLMHMQGEPETMQASPSYGDVVLEVRQFLEDRVEAAIGAGIPRENLILDPGIGFGKTTAHNLDLIGNLRELAMLGLPLFVGASRKRFLGSLLGDLPVEERVEASLAAHVAASLGGAHLIRTHDVRETARALKVADALREAARTRAEEIPA